MHKINYSTILPLFISTIFWVILGATPSFAQTLVWHEWKADSQTKGGKTVSCFLQLNTLTSDSMNSELKVSSSTLITANLTLLLVERHNQKGVIFTVKIIGERILENLTTQVIPIHYAWVQSSTGSTATQIIQAETKPEKYFLGALGGDDGMDLFIKIFKGMIKDGLVVGWQESPGKFDIVIKVKDPPSQKNQETFMSCFRQLAEELPTQ